MPADHHRPSRASRRAVDRIERIDGKTITQSASVTDRVGQASRPPSARLSGACSLPQPWRDVLAVQQCWIVDDVEHEPDAFGGVAGETELLVPGQRHLGSERPGRRHDAGDHLPEVVRVVHGDPGVDPCTGQPVLEVFQLVGEPCPGVRGEVRGPLACAGSTPSNREWK